MCVSKRADVLKADIDAIMNLLTRSAVLLIQVNQGEKTEVVLKTAQGHLLSAKRFINHCNL